MFTLGVSRYLNYNQIERVCPYLLPESKDLEKMYKSEWLCSDWNDVASPVVI